MGKMRVFLQGIELDDLTIAALEIIDDVEFGVWLNTVWEKDRMLAAETHERIKSILDETHNRLGMNWTASEMYEVLQALTMVIRKTNQDLKLSGLWEVKVADSFAGNMLRSRTVNS